MAISPIVFRSQIKSNAELFCACECIIEQVVHSNIVCKSPVVVGDEEVQHESNLCAAE